MREKNFEIFGDSSPSRELSLYAFILQSFPPFSRPTHPGCFAVLRRAPRCELDVCILLRESKNIQDMTFGKMGAPEKLKEGSGKSVLAPD